jgi:hypothetical protein
MKVAREPVAAAPDGLEPVKRIGEAVIRAREDAQLPRLSRALEENLRVAGRHHVVGLALHHEDMTRPGGSVQVVARADLGDQRRSRRRDVVAP